MSGTHAELIDTYARGAEKLSLAIRGLTSDDLRAVPIPGKWCIQQVVIHLADAEAVLADRMKRIIAMDNPALLSWDENLFAKKLHYNNQSAQDAVTMIDLTRRQLSTVLRHLPDADFQRTGHHSERGPQTLLDVLNFAITHLDHHLKFIFEKREKMGKSMW